MKSLKLAILTVLTLSLLFEGCTIISRVTGRATQESETQRQTAQVQRGTLETTISAPGTVSMPQKKSLTFGVSGTLKEVKAAEGDRVKKGQVLASIDASSLERAVKQAKTNLDSAKKNLEDARVPYKESDIARARVTVANAKVALQSAQESLDKARTPYKESDIAKARVTVANAKVALQSAQESLDKARTPYKESDIAKARVAIANAKVAVENAQEELDKAKKPYTDQQIDQLTATASYAQVTLESAKIDLSMAQTDWATKLEDAQTQLDSSKDAYRQKVRIYYGLEMTDAELYQDPIIVTARGATSETIYGWMALHPRPPTQQTIDSEIQTAWSNLVTARDNLASLQVQRDKSIANAENNVTRAQETLAQAQDNLAKALEAPNPLLIDLRTEQVASAKSSLKDAEDNLAEMLAGADPLDVKLKEEQVASAKAALKDAEDSLAEMLASPDPLDVKLKEEQVASAKAAQKDAEDSLAEMLAGADPLDIALKEVQVSTAEGSLEQSQKNLAKASILAPFDGVVTKLGSFYPGDDVGASAVIFELIDPNTLELNATVDEIDIFEVRTSQEVRITFDALPQATLRGTVSKIALVAQRQAGVVSFPVSISITPPRGIEIRDGLNASAEIVVASKENALMVPSRAIRTSGRNRVVDVLVEGKQQERTVSVGMTSGQWIEVTQGLSEGDVVLLPAGTTAPTSQPFRGGMGGGVVPGMPPGGFR